jgi:hypothetical protein
MAAAAETLLPIYNIHPGQCVAAGKQPPVGPLPSCRRPRAATSPSIPNKSTVPWKKH